MALSSQQSWFKWKGLLLKLPVLSVFLPIASPLSRRRIHSLVISQKCIWDGLAASTLVTLMKRRLPRQELQRERSRECNPALLSSPAWNLDLLQAQPPPQSQ